VNVIRCASTCPVSPKRKANALKYTRPYRTRKTAVPVFFTADLHFGHERICDYASRPFASTRDMDEALIDNWNATVSAGDEVWVLGDYAMGDRARGLSYLPRLNGRVRLIEGNHDRSWAGVSNGWAYQREYLDAGFEFVGPHARITLTPGRTVMLSHFPYEADHTARPRHHQYRLRDEGSWLLHGHVHTAYTVRSRGINVGVDRWNYAPVAAETLARLIDNLETLNHTTPERP
jgi:calcineurin-like phosphoesterase family protein